MSSRDHFTYRVQWSPEDQGFVGTVAEFPSLSWISEDPRAAFDGIRDALDEVLADMAETGETPPTPFTERSFSGKFLVRIPPEAHRSLAIEAAEQNISLNRLAAHRLAGA